MTDLSKTKPSIFITGAGSGIGAATARHFHDKGWRVGLADRDQQAVTALAGVLGSDAWPIGADVLDHAGLEAAIAGFVRETGRLDVLFNSAGLLDMHPFETAALDRLGAVIDVNVKGVINAIAAALPFLKAQENARIITMSSAAAIYGVPDLAVYSASKFAVRGLTEALNIELENKGVWVCDIMVGYVDTPMLSDADAQAKSVEIAGVHVTPQVVAETVFQATTNKQVHWFVRDADQEAQSLFDATPPEERRELIRPATGY